MATMTLDDLVSQLRSAHRESLMAVVLYGSEARGDTHGKHSDRNVLVVLREFAEDRLAAAAAVTRAWGEGGDPALLMLTSAEWQSSADIFAIEHADVRAHHRVLYLAPGYDPFAEAVGTREDLRRQLEYEAMAILLRVRSALLGTARDGKQATAVLTGSLGSVLALFRAAVRLGGAAGGAEPSGDSDTLCEQVGALCGIDAAPFKAVVAHRRNGTAIAVASAPGVLERYHRGLQQFVQWVDAVPPAA
jgi:hypothetical protein